MVTNIWKTNENFQVKITEALTTVSDNFNKKLEETIQPIQTDVANHETQIEILKTQMGEYAKKQESESNRRRRG